MLHAYLLFAILLLTLVLFIWNYWRYDVVALIALIISVVVGIVPYQKAFTGFANPAVITVASVMVISFAITESGVIDYIIKRLAPVTKNEILHIVSLTLITGFLSAFMNNVGALALMMPVAIKTAIDNNRSPSLVLMPIAFASVLGGLTTAIGTPPNLLISAYRQQITGHSFAMFDFTPVGIIAAVIGIIFIAILGWRLLPLRKAPKQAEDMFHMEDYIAEIKVPKESAMIGKTIGELETIIEADLQIVGMIRNKRKSFKISVDEPLQANDIFIVEASHNVLKKLLTKTKLTLIGDEQVTSSVLRSKDVGLMEAVVPQGSRVEGRSSISMRLRSRFRLNLLALARQGKPFKERLHHVSWRAGDVVLLQGENESLQENIVGMGLLPLVERGIKIKNHGSAWFPLIIFIVAIILAATGLLQIDVAFVLAIVVMLVLKVIPLRSLYDAIDWPIIILLAAMIPVGQALQTTGGTDLIVHGLLIATTHIPVYGILFLLFIVTMTLSDVINNAATAVLMAPIAASLAQSMHLNIDPFLMTVAVAASCSFLTPISHQNNTLVMGPGGYKFFDYFRMGLPLEILIMVVAIPMILWVWPLH